MSEMTRKFYFPDIKYDEAYGEQVLFQLSDMLRGVYEPNEIPNYLNDRLSNPNTGLTDVIYELAHKINTDFTVMDAYDEDFVGRDKVPRDVLSQIRGYMADDELANDCRLSGYVLASLLKGIDYLKVGLSNYSYANLTAPVHLATIVENKMRKKRKDDYNFYVIHFGVGRPGLRAYHNLGSAGGIMMPLNARNVGLLEDEVAKNYEPFLRTLEQNLPFIPESNSRKRNAFLRMIRLGR